MNYSEKILHYLIFAVSSLAVAGALVYRVYQLDWYGIVASLLLCGIAFWLYHSRQKKAAPGLELVRPKITLGRGGERRLAREYIWLIAYSAIWCFAVWVLLRSASSEAMISPWQTVPGYFLALYSGMTLLLAFILRGKKPLAAVMLAGHFFLTFCVALFAYRLGYGFDPFVHQATEELISRQGAVYPKPPYYLGQYALIVIAHKLSFAPIALIDKWLVGVLSSILLPWTAWTVLKRWFEDQGLAGLAILGVLLIPFPFFILTTPQNLAYLFLILALLLCLKPLGNTSLVLPASAALASLSVHPLAGIPAVIFVLMRAIEGASFKLKRIAYASCFILLCFALPIAFRLAASGQADGGAARSQASADFWRTAFGFSNNGQEGIILNSAYFLINNQAWLIAALIAAGAVLAWRYRDGLAGMGVYAHCALALVVSYLISSFQDFSYLISYEQEDFLRRMVFLAVIFLLPLLLMAAYAAASAALKQPAKIKLILALFMAAASAVSLYARYPRFDNYHNSRGYSVGQADFAAAKWVHDDAGPGNYVALANQQASAAALKLYGFAKYYRASSSAEEIFYYPIPTGAPLYRYYLDMVYQSPKKETARAALRLTGADTAYFVLNKYWWAFPKIAAEAKLEADSWQEIDGGEIIVFKYLK